MPLVVHLLPETSDAGAENQARYLAAGLAQRPEWDVEVAYFRKGRAHDGFERLEIPVRQVPPRGKLIFDLYPRARALRSLYAEQPPAILHSWLFEANVVGAVAARAWKSTKLVIAQRSGTLEREVRRVQRTAWIIRARADHAIANSHDGVALLQDLGFPASHTSLIRNGFALPPELSAASPHAQMRAARNELGIDAASTVIGYVGRPDAAKDLPTLFSAMRQLWQEVPSAQLLLVGLSPKDVQMLGMGPDSRVRAMGWVKTPMRIMGAFDILVSSSWSEGYSNSVCEAMLAGVPVACTATGGHTSVVEETGGKVVPIRRPDLLANAMVALLRSPPDRLEVASRAARLLSMEPVVEATHQLYARLLDGAA